jgi:hypothetical protein
MWNGKDQFRTGKKNSCDICEVLVSADFGIEAFGYQENGLGYNSLRKPKLEVECNNWTSEGVSQVCITFSNIIKYT